MNKGGWLSIVAAAMLLAVAVIAEAQQPKKIPRIGFLTIPRLPLARFATTHSGKACASLATWGKKHSH